MMKKVYDHPRYYEIAFSYRDIPAEVDIFEECFKKHAQKPVESILEIACGNSPHLEELLKRGYVYTGLDISQSMLAYSIRKASALNGVAEFVRADMLDFTIDETYDFVFIALGSLNLHNSQEIFSHFWSVASVLREGGLYLLDWCVHFSPFSNREESWTMEQGEIKVNTHWYESLFSAPDQLVEEKFTLEVVDHGMEYSFVESGIKRAIFPQEFLQIIEQINELEFVGWWNNWDLGKPLGKVKNPEKINRPIILLRKKKPGMELEQKNG